MSYFHRHRELTPYLLLAPGVLFLAVFFVVPLGFLAYQSLESGNIDFGYAFTWSWSNYWHALRDYRAQFVRSLEYAVRRWRRTNPSVVARVLRLERAGTAMELIPPSPSAARCRPGARR